MVLYFIICIRCFISYLLLTLIVFFSFCCFSMDSLILWSNSTNKPNVHTNFTQIAYLWDLLPRVERELGGSGAGIMVLVRLLVVWAKMLRWGLDIACMSEIWSRRWQTCFDCSSCAGNDDEWWMKWQWLREKRNYLVRQRVNWAIKGYSSPVLPTDTTSREQFVHFSPRFRIISTRRCFLLKRHKKSMRIEPESIVHLIVEAHVIDIVYVWKPIYLCPDSIRSK